MSAATILDELAASTPHLPGARCAGRHALYDLTTEADRTGPAGAHVLKSARAEALRLCAGCPELAPCGAWLDSLPPKHQPLGVVAGRIITGRRRRATTPKEKNSVHTEHPHRHKPSRTARLGPAIPEQRRLPETYL